MANRWEVLSRLLKDVSKPSQLATENEEKARKEYPSLYLDSAMLDNSELEVGDSVQIIGVGAVTRVEQESEKTKMYTGIKDIRPKHYTIEIHKMAVDKSKAE